MKIAPAVLDIYNELFFFVYSHICSSQEKSTHVGLSRKDYITSFKISFLQVSCADVLYRWDVFSLNQEILQSEPKQH